MRPDVTILSSGHNVADARLHRHCAALLRAGLRVEVIAQGRQEDAPTDVGFRPITAQGIVGRGLQALLLPAKARGRVFVTIDPDLILTAALRRFFTPRRRFAVDLHEDYAALLADRPWAKGLVGSVAQVWVRTAITLSRHADLTIVADQHVPPSDARRRLVVQNLPDRSLLPEPAEPGTQPRALYIGDVRESRGLFTMLRTIELAPKWELDIVGPVAAADQARVDAWVMSSLASARVRFHGRMPPAEAWQLAVGAWAGLSLLERTPAFDDAIPSKIYEYLACGLPVVTTPLKRAAELVKNAAAGVVINHPEEAAAHLRAWSGEGRTDLDSQRQAALKWIQRELADSNPYERFAEAVAALAAEVPRV